jgi:hypothetical protein
MTLTSFEFYFNIWQSYYFFYNILSMQSATLIFMGIALALLFVIIIQDIFDVEQYVQSEVMHFLTYSTMKEFAS